MICLGLGSSVNECGPLDKQAAPQRLLFLTWATLPCTAAHLGKLETLTFSSWPQAPHLRPLLITADIQIYLIYLYIQVDFLQTQSLTLCVCECMCL